MYTDIRRVLLDTASEVEVTFEDRTLTLTKMEPISWVPWVEGDVEGNAVFLSRITCNFNDQDVINYFELWCRQSVSGNAVIRALVGKNGRAVVHFKNRIGIYTHR